MIRVLTLAGTLSDPALREQVHQIEHLGGVETVRLSRQDLSRRRQQVRTDRGTELALMLDRDAALENGSVLLLEAARAVVVELDEPTWLVLRPVDAARGLALGYFAGNMHWKVRFEGDCLCVAMEGPREGYLQRLAALIGAGVSVVADAAAVPGNAHSSVHSHSHDHGHRQSHSHSHSQDHAHPHDHVHPHPHDHALAHDPVLHAAPAHHHDR